MMMIKVPSPSRNLKPLAKYGITGMDRPADSKLNGVLVEARRTRVRLGVTVAHHHHHGSDSESESAERAHRRRHQDPALPVPA
jgi:hypothetical protein